MKMIENYINRIAFVLDESSSMRPLKETVIKVIDSQVEHLAQTSQLLNQETRISVYTFSDDVKNLIWNKDVLRLPSLKGHYNPNGMTALLDATLNAIEDLKKSTELYGDESTLIFVVSDGEANINVHLHSKLKETINNLPESWTLAFLAPNATGVASAKRYGFPASNIQIWDVSSKGFEEMGIALKTATTNFMTGRAKGVRGTKNLFKIDASSITTSVVKNNLEELKASEYDVLPVRQEAYIKEYVEKFTKNPYTVGSGYYELTKKETIQPNKHICVRNNRNGKLYSGKNARQLINLPDYEIKVAPENFGEYKIYVQSNSVNRRLVKGTDLIILK